MWLGGGGAVADITYRLRNVNNPICALHIGQNLSSPADGFLAKTWALSTSTLYFLQRYFVDGPCYRLIAEEQGKILGEHTTKI